ncbi:MAG TPA: S41 family peptidase, partial [Burkholderiales bacterium]|nr:S41 family peptidase [Burkholderiales bacterium]
MRCLALLLAVVAILSACGGGGGDGGGSGATVASASGWIPGVFTPAVAFEAQCAAPRSGIDSQGSTLTENNWLRSWSNDLYLWYDEIVDRDPALWTTPAYFNLLKTSATKDKFHFTVDTPTWVAFSQSGVSTGYGAEWAVIARVPPRRVVVAFTEPNSPATTGAANLARGAEVLMVDGVDVVNDNTPGGIATLNAGVFPATSGETHTFTVHDLGAPPNTTRTFTMRSDNVTQTPVQNVKTIGAVGYMLFNDHIATAESGLVNAVNTLKAANVTDLVLDIRYNGGGYLDIANELAFMIAGRGPTAGHTFEKLVFNAKHPTIDPVTGRTLAPIPFHTTTRGFSVASGQSLPTLDLRRVFVLTGTGTCSASESIINALRGVGVEVIQVGSTTCGKPYGFYAKDNCGTTYFTIQFKGVNALGFGDYADGFSPSNTAGVVGTPVPGCSVADDFNHALGDPAEAR